MSDDDPRLMELAGKILDGETVDWDAASGSQSEYVEEFRALGTLAKLGTAPASGPLGDWGPLRLIDRVGEGAFGEVFRAWDTRLDREVALKLLRPAPPEPGHHTTVITEGRLLARVRHPNVVTVFGAEQVDGRIGIWTEFVHGSTLQHHVDTQGPMTVPAAMEVGRVLCAALAAIHVAGVVHGDVKAQNVLREPAGRLVLVDLGTGREHLQGAGSPGGPISGTPLYMAPELWRGELPTPQSDVYSLGVLMYFLVSGAHPIAGATAAEVREAHQAGHHVPLRERGLRLPAVFTAAVERALEPDPTVRFQSAEAFAQALTVTSDAGARRIVPRSLVGRLAVALAALAIAGAWAMDLDGVSTRMRWAAAGAAPARWETRPLTVTGDAPVLDISPDGKILFYARTPENNLWIRNLETGEDREILTDPSSAIRAATVTPDGLSVDAMKANGELWRVPLEDTGPRRLIASGVRSPPGWSPDGMHMAFIRRFPSEPTSSVVITDPEGRGERELVGVTNPTSLVGRGDAGFPAMNRPAWSPDGQTIAAAGYVTSKPTVIAHVALIDVETGARSETTLTPQASTDAPAILQVAWLDQARLAVNTQIDGRGPYQLSILDTRTLAWERITNDSSVYRGVSLTRDRMQLITTRVEGRTGIWLADGGAPVSILMPESGSMPSDGTFDSKGNFLYSTTTSDGPAVWVLRKGTSTPAFVARGTWPAITPAGDVVLFVGVDEKPGLYRAALDGSGVRQLASRAWGKLAISPDSSTVFYTAGGSSGQQSVWAVPVAGGPPRELARSRTYNFPSVSPDGRHLLYSTVARTDPTTPVFLVCELPDCTNPREFVKPGWASSATITWAPDGAGIAYARLGVSPENIWVQPLDGSPVWQLTQFGDDRAIRGFSWSPDGGRLAVTRISTLSDAVLLTRNRW